MTLEDQTRIHRMARRLAWTRALHNDPDETTKDLEQAAYERSLKPGKPTHFWQDIEYAMLEELSRWNYGCKRGRGKNRILTCKLSFDDKVLIRGVPKPLWEVLV